jgi:hypothetical protein
METITVSRTADRDFMLTRVRDLETVTETHWCESWSAVYRQLREWRVQDDGIQNIEYQLTQKALAVVQSGLLVR